MSDERRPLPELDQLLSDLLDGHLTDEQHSRLQHILREDSAAREKYRSMMLLDAALSTECGVGADTAYTGQISQQGRSHAAAGSWRWISLVALAASILVAVLLWQPWRDRQDPAEFAGHEPKPATSAAPATVTRLIDVTWEAKQSPLQVGQALSKDWLKLQRGVVQLEFGDGARVSLKGPARMRIDAPDQCFVEFGKLTVLAPPRAANFKVFSPAAEVVDLGTEFGLLVGQDGAVDLHVLDGEVELTARSKSASHKDTVLENHAASVPAGRGVIVEAPFEPELFEPLRDRTLRRKQPLRIQFDCGSQAGLYQGTESPAHAAGDLHVHERFWNLSIGDQSGRFLAADGSTLPYEIEVDFGRHRHEQRRFDWDAEPMTDRAPEGPALGVFDTPLGEDNLAGGRKLGIRLRGLPPGRYRVYVLGRPTLQHRRRGNMLVETTHMAAVGVNVADVDAIPVPMPLEMRPLEDPDAERWVDGQTHVVAEISVKNPEDYLTIITRHDRQKSRVKKFPSVILGFQVVQMEASEQ